MSESLTFGSVCSGIEASQLAFQEFGFQQVWSSEIADFPSKVLKHHYPEVQNVGDMIQIPDLILEESIASPDIFCGGTPCQAFSLAGWKNGLKDERGQLTMTFIDIADAIDSVRNKKGLTESIILWENVEGVLNDKTNAFGNFLAGLAGFEMAIVTKKWYRAGFLRGPKRNVAWRVIDAKYYGVPQQRRRLYVLAGGKDFNPENVLFEMAENDISAEIKNRNRKKESIPSLFSVNEEDCSHKFKFEKNGHKIQIFREHTDCLYSAYGTKWNGNAAAYNGSLYVAQNERIRRLLPLECERLMGIPDNYTKVEGNSHTNRYQAIGNSWPVPVVNWIGRRIDEYLKGKLLSIRFDKLIRQVENNHNTSLFEIDGVQQIGDQQFINASVAPNIPNYGTLRSVVEPNEVIEKFYLSKAACAGILRRKRERNYKMNPELEQLMIKISESNAESKIHRFICRTWWN